MGAGRDASAPSDSDPGVSLRQRLGSGLLLEVCPAVSLAPPLVAAVRPDPSLVQSGY